MIYAPLLETTFSGWVFNSLCTMGARNTTADIEITQHECTRKGVNVCRKIKRAGWGKNIKARDGNWKHADEKESWKLTGL